MTRPFSGGALKIFTCIIFGRPLMLLENFITERFQADFSLTITDISSITQNIIIVHTRISF